MCISVNNVEGENVKYKWCFKSAELSTKSFKEVLSVSKSRKLAETSIMSSYPKPVILVSKSIMLDF